MNISSSSLPYRCVSSQVLSHILLLRNDITEANGEAEQSLYNALYTELPPIEPEEDLEEGEANEFIKSASGSIMARCLAEIPIFMVVITSTIELLAYTIFTSATFFVSFVYDKPYETSKKLLDSSFFTVQWSTGNLISNLVEDHLPTHESFERVQKTKSPRPEDRFYIETYFQADAQRYRLNQIAQN